MVRARTKFCVQRVVSASNATTYTLIDDGFLPVSPVNDYLRFLTDDGASPHTRRAYATGLAAWFNWLHVTGNEWNAVTSSMFGDYLAWLRSGVLPGEARIGPRDGLGLAPSTVKLRAAAVLAFYRWQYAAHGLQAPYEALYTSLAKRGRRPYVELLAGVADSPKSVRPMYRIRSGPKGRTPLLTPSQVDTILNTCSLQLPDGSWSGSPAALRDRLLFAAMAETGMRLGEALSLRHCDIHIGRGETPAIDITPRQDHPHLARVKSNRHRRVYIGDGLEALYAAYVWSLVDRQADMVVSDFPAHFVFVNLVDKGHLFEPLRPETVYAKVRSLRRKRADTLPAKWSPHWLRHTHATALLLAGCPPHVVMRRLGHLDIQTTLSVYGWVTEDAELRAVADWRAFADGWQKELEHT